MGPQGVRHDWDTVTFLMFQRCREMKQEEEEMRRPSEMAQTERKCVRDVERHRETQEAGRSQGHREIATLCQRCGPENLERH